VKGSFSDLFDAMSAAVQRDAAALAALVSTVDTGTFERVAIRHKCAGLLWAAIDEHGLRLPRPLLGLRRYAAFAMTDNIALLQQAESAGDVLAAASIDHAVLKGAARLRAGVAGATFTHHFDLDILVRASDAERAYRALLEAGYAPQYDAAKVAWYRKNHHHLAPLTIANGKPLELHVALQPRAEIDVDTSWEALEARLAAQAPHRFRLDPLGQALHLIVHGADGTRLLDTVLLAALLRDDPSLRAKLESALGAAAQNVAIAAMLAAADQLCGLEPAASRNALRYRRWVDQREDLPAWLRARSQFVDAWHLNGGRLFGPATRRAMVTPDSSTLASRSRAVGRTAGRAATSVAAALASLLA
jgi:hypothetical protein